MLKIDNVVLPSPECYMFTVKGMRNAKNSWDRNDSKIEGNEFIFGENDFNLGMNLSKAGTDHAKYRRFLPVNLEITAPLYWWKEFETYRVGVYSNPTEIEFNSCSTMHTIDKKEFTIDDFSHEHLLTDNIDISDNIKREAIPGSYVPALNRLGEFKISSISKLYTDIALLNAYRELYITLGDKKYWDNIIQNLPSSYNQMRSVSLNYEVLANIYHSRRHHKLDEWHVICDWIESLPYSEIITGKMI